MSAKRTILVWGPGSFTSSMLTCMLCCWLQFCCQMFLLHVMPAAENRAFSKLPPTQFTRAFEEAAKNYAHMRIWRSSPVSMTTTLEGQIASSLASFTASMLQAPAMNTESWCQVEGSSNQQWTRATRRHYEHALKSSVFEENTAKTSEGRMAWAKETKPDKLELHELAKRRHFKQKCKLKLKLMYNRNKL